MSEELAKEILGEVAERVLESHCIKCGRPVSQMDSMFMRGDGEIECGAITQCYDREREQRRRK